MFLQRLVAASNSLFHKKPHQDDPTEEARVILSRLRELELPPAKVAPSSEPESDVVPESVDFMLVVNPNRYGQRTYSENTH